MSGSNTPLKQLNEPRNLKATSKETKHNHRVYQFDRPENMVIVFILNLFPFFGLQEYLHVKINKILTCNVPEFQVELS
jgi:hypothetical protein